MANSVLFGSKVVKLPGTYARIISGIKAESLKVIYGNFLLIDAGAGVGFNSAIGIVGKGKEAIYALNESEAGFYLKGGPLSPVISALFNPDKGVKGISTLYLIKSATSTKASVSGTVVSLFQGAITASKIETVEEGVICNTILTSEKLTKGYQIKSVYDNILSKAYIEIWMGSYEGTNQGGYIIGTTETLSSPVLVYRSKKCSTPKELYDYLTVSHELKALVTISDLTLVDTVFDTDAINNLPSTNPELFDFSGGTDSYSTDLTDVFENIKDLDYSYMCVLEADGTQTFLSDLKEHIVNDAKGIKNFATFAGDFDSAIDLSKSINFDGSICCSGICKKTSKSAPSGFIIHDDMVTMAYILGRICGLSPEISGTLKSLNIDGLSVEPSDKKLEDLLDSGVIVPYYDADLSKFVLSQAVTTLQENSVFINEDCTTYSVQAKRIITQIVKILQKNSKIDFFGGDVATNKGRLSLAYLKSWTEGELEKLVVNQNKVEANYLLRYEVKSVVHNDISTSVEISFDLVLNSEITKVFFVGTVLSI